VPGGTQGVGAERRERVLTLIGERPGITVSELSEEIGVDAPSLYRVVRRLLQDQAVRKDGRGLWLV
jgi:DNA-binding MarR family transcriptional regulator